VYLSVLPMSGIANAPQDRVATAVMEVAFGAVGAKVMAAAILVSTFGCVNGMVLAGARVYYAMSQDGLFFKSTGKLDSKGVPKNSLWMQCAWTCLLCLSGQYGNLLDYVILAALVFYALTIVGLIVLRTKQPDAARPYRAIGYPVLPAVYIVMAVWICGVLLRYKPQYTWPGLILVLLGVPVYMVWRRVGSGSQTARG
jgi:APA family basic amino acid/polyamine antiporter